MCIDMTQPANSTPPGNAPLPFDATLLFKALQYQLLVAVEHCHALEPHQCLWIEVYGDVTVPGKTQTEVKLYSDNLTDGHPNFWNTLKNWLNEGFDHASYDSLVLLTSQEFSAQTHLKGWNGFTAAQKLKVMETIFAASQAPVEKKSDKKSKGDSNLSQPSKSQSLQQYVMAPERRPALMEILERMEITTGAETLEQRIHKYQTIHLKPIRPSKYQNFIDDILGFMCSTKLVNNGWQITYKAFADKISELTKHYMKHPTTFPPVDVAAIKKNIDIEEIKSRVFAKKIIEIGGEHRLKRAALHKVIAETTISDLYADGVLFKPDVTRYLNNHLESHKDGRELAMLYCKGTSCLEELKDLSMKFFLERHNLPVEQFCGMESTMTEFRNGIYHMLSDEHPEDEEDEFHWRLW
ncbi:hypothetical protein HT111_24315 [Pseudomonas aeruginosa]|nr:hypothetical protein [Pseudomonas aeruginosa]